MWSLTRSIHSAPFQNPGGVTHGQTDKVWKMWWLILDGTMHYVFKSIVALHSFMLKLCSVKYIVHCTVVITRYNKNIVWYISNPRWKFFTYRISEIWNITSNIYCAPYLYLIMLFPLKRQNLECSRLNQLCTTLSLTQSKHTSHISLAASDKITKLKQHFKTTFTPPHANYHIRKTIWAVGVKK